MHTYDSNYYVIGDLDGYWTIKQSSPKDYFVTKFLSSGSVLQYQFDNLKDTERHILNHIYENILPMK